MSMLVLEPGHGGHRSAALGGDVRAGLSARPRSIPPKYLYDERGSRLFDAICELPEYYLTRTESSLLDLHAESLVNAVGPATLIEIGSGMARKTHSLLAPICARARRPAYVAFDIDRHAIEASARAVGLCFPKLRVHGVRGDFARDLGWIERLPLGQGPRLYAFLGSTIGNLDDDAAVNFLRNLAVLMAAPDRLLLGVDLVKDPRVLHAAYNDVLGVTAAFNRNVLRVVARELDGDVDEGGFEHLAFYDPTQERVEMHLVATRAQRMVLRAIRLDLDFAPGEHLLTEISRKFTHATVERTLARAGMLMERWIPDANDLVALTVARRG